MHIFNTHLHCLVGEDLVRDHQTKGLLHWINIVTDPEDIVIITGDFNAIPTSSTYALITEDGFKSAHHEVHSKEPEYTFPTGI